MTGAGASRLSARRSTIGSAYLLLLLALWFVTAAQFARAVWPMLVFPFGIDYGEGIVWKQMDDIVHGRGYPPVAGFPAIVFHYPPVYHLVTAAAATVAPSPLIAGRAVSLLATLVSFVLAGLLTWRLQDQRDARTVRLMGALSTAVILASTSNLRIWAASMRVDMLACAFELAGLCFALAALRKPSHIYAAAIFFVAALFTKQVEIAGPIAAFGVLLIARPGLFVRGVAISIVIGGAITIALLVLTQGRIFAHLVLYNINTFLPCSVLWKFRLFVQPDILPVTLGCCGALVFLVALARDALRRRDWRAVVASEGWVAQAIMLAFFLLKTASLIGIGKIGGWSNYLIEWHVAAAIYAGLLTTLCLRWSRVDGAPAARMRPELLVFPLVFAGAIALMPDKRELPDLALLRDSSARLGRMLPRIHGPVISEDMAILMQQGRPVLWEPAIFQVLAQTGRYDDRPVVEAIDAGRIAAVVTLNVDERYTPAVAAAIKRALPVEEHAGRWTVHLARPIAQQ